MHAADLKKIPRFNMGGPDHGDPGGPAENAEGEWVKWADIEKLLPEVEINPCPRCGEPCRIVAVRCDKVVVCCTYPRLDYVKEGSLLVHILHGCGYTSPMERHPLDCIDRHNRETAKHQDKTL